MRRRIRIYFLLWLEQSQLEMAFPSWKKKALLSDKAIWEVLLLGDKKH